MKFDRPWTAFALEAEHKAFGMIRIAKAHNEYVAAKERDLAEASEALRLIADNGGKVTGGPDGFLNCNGVWCAEMARSALRKQESGEVKHG